MKVQEELRAGQVAAHIEKTGRYRGLKQGNNPVKTGTLPEDYEHNRKVEAERLYKRLLNPRVPEKQKLKIQRRLLALGYKITERN